MNDWLFNIQCSLLNQCFLPFITLFSSSSACSFFLLDDDDDVYFLFDDYLELNFSFSSFSFTIVRTHISSIGRRIACLEFVLVHINKKKKKRCKQRFTHGNSFNVNTDDYL
jgi:hypothetical protein